MFAFSMLVAVLVSAVILLLPILLPVLAAADAWETRRLARTRCIACGTAIGRAEIQRAQIDARAKGRGIVDSMLALGLRPRIVITWDVTCTACGQVYEYRPGGAQRPALVAKT